MVKPHRSIKRGTLMDFLIALLLGLFCLTTLYPFVNFLALSFNEGYDSMYGGIYLWPRVFTLENYRQAFEHPMIFNSFKVSILRTLVQTVASLLLTAMMAYGLTQKDMPGRKGIVFFFFFTTIFSGGLIPSFILYRQLKILNTFWVLVLPGLLSFYNTIVMKTFFDGVPPAVRESAQLDGAGELTIFARILLPLCKPVLATIALFVGVGAWNDWFNGAFFIQFNQKMVPASTLLYQIIAEASFEVSAVKNSGSSLLLTGANNLAARAVTPEALRMTFVVIIVTPIICVYPFLQRYFVKGVMVGSMKE